LLAFGPTATPSSMSRLAIIRARNPNANCLSELSTARLLSTFSSEKCSDNPSPPPTQLSPPASRPLDLNPLVGSEGSGGEPAAGRREAGVRCPAFEITFLFASSHETASLTRDVLRDDRTDRTWHLSVRLSRALSPRALRILIPRGSKFGTCPGTYLCV